MNLSILTIEQTFNNCRKAYEAHYHNKHKLQGHTCKICKAHFALYTELMTVSISIYCTCNGISSIDVNCNFVDSKQHRRKEHRGDPVPCPDCGTMFADRKNMMRHKREMHSSIDVSNLPHLFNLYQNGEDFERLVCTDHFRSDFPVRMHPARCQLSGDPSLRLT